MSEGKKAGDEYHNWMTLLMRPDKIGYTHRTGQRPAFSESTYWDAYATRTKFYDGPAKVGATYKRPRTSARSGVGASASSRRSIRTTGRSIAGVDSARSSVAASRVAVKARHRRRMEALQGKLEAARTRRAESEKRVGELNAQIDKICDAYGRIQVANPGQNLEEMEPLHRWELYLERTTNNLVALEEERRRQLGRREIQKAAWNKQDLGRG